MLSFFKRSDTPAAKPPVAAAPVAAAAAAPAAEPAPASSTSSASTAKAPPRISDERRRFPRPLPLPEVIEGDGDTDWAMWEETLAQQKNQK